MKSRETVDWGIDLGTTNSSIAVLEGRNIKIIKNKKGSENTPSAVYEKKSGDRVIKHIGEIAKQKQPKDHEHVATEFKQKMGLKDWHFDFPSTGRRATAVDLSTEVLSELIKSVKQKTGEDIRAALITVPAAFKQPQYEDTKNAGRKTGIEYVELLGEPIAAALAYGLKPDIPSNVIWLVYDLGGGTFDTALVKVEDRIFAIIDHEGLPYFGGKNLDAAIVERYFVPELPSTIKEKVIPWKSSSWWALKSMAEEAKCQLSTEDEYTIDDSVDGHNLLYTLTKDQLNSLEAQIFSPTIEKCRELLSRNKFSSKHIEKVNLIGGSTLSPHLRKMMEELEIPIDFSVDPLTAVAFGAAIYAAGRKIPNGSITKIGKEKVGKKEAFIHVELKYPTSIREEECMVTGRLESRKKGIAITSGWSIEINRVDEGGNVEWSSGRISLAENGGFAEHVPIEDGENLFKLLVLDTNGKPVETNREDFSIRYLIESISPKLPRGIGVGDTYGEVIWFFEKGADLPAEKPIILKTTKVLKRGEKGDAINIPVIEGNEHKTYLNHRIGELKVEAVSVLTDVPEGSNVEVTIRIDESQTIIVNALIEDYDVEQSTTMGTWMDLDSKELHKELKKERLVFSLLKKVANVDQEIFQIVCETEDSGMIEEIERLISQTSQENPESAQEAMLKIIELRKKIDPVIEKGNKLLKWQPHKEWCDRNVQVAKTIIGEIEDLPFDWLEQFDQLLRDYEEAIKNKVFKRTEKIAYENLPDLFLRSEKMREMVGGRGVQKRESERIFAGEETNSDIKR